MFYFFFFFFFKKFMTLTFLLIHSDNGVRWSHARKCHAIEGLLLKLMIQAFMLSWRQMYGSPLNAESLRSREMVRWRNPQNIHHVRFIFTYKPGQRARQEIDETNIPEKARFAIDMTILRDYLALFNGVGGKSFVQEGLRVWKKGELKSLCRPAIVGRWGSCRLRQQRNIAAHTNKYSKWRIIVQRIICEQPFLRVPQCSGLGLVQRLLR